MPEEDSPLLRISEAADLVGVSPATLRLWEKRGRLRSHRNPSNGYRLYDTQELIELQQSIKRVPASQNGASIIGTSGKEVRQLVNRIARIQRDTDGSSDIIGRFDELSKILFLETCSKRAVIPASAMQQAPGELESRFGSRIKSDYERVAKLFPNLIPPRFRTINSSERAVVAIIKEVNDFVNYASADALGLAYEEMVRRTFDKSENQQFFTPPQVDTFIGDLLPDRSLGVVCDPACGSGGLLVELVKRGASIDSVIGLEIDERLAWVTGVNMFAHGLPLDKFHVRFSPEHGSLGCLAHDLDGSVDTIVTNPPFGSDVGDPDLLQHYLLGRGRSSRRRGILFLERCWSLLKPQGRLVTVIDEGVLSLPNAADVRTFLRTNFWIEGIIALPESAFMPYANVNTSILILRRKDSSTRDKLSTFMAIASEVGRRSNGDDDIIYAEDGSATLNSDLPEIASAWAAWNGSTRVQKSGPAFVIDLHKEAPDLSSRIDARSLEPHKRAIEERLSAVGALCVPLRELCDEVNEAILPNEELEGELIAYCGLAHIEPKTGKFRREVIPAVSLKSQVKRFEHGDILFAKMRPNLRKVALVDTLDGGFVSPECAVLRIKRDSSGPLIDAGLLAALLRSDLVYAQVEGKVAGIGRPRIASADLLETLIPLPEDNRLRAAVRRHLANVEIEGRLRAELAELEGRLARHVSNAGARLADLLMGGDMMDPLADQRRMISANFEPFRTAEWLNSKVGPGVQLRLQNQNTMRRIRVRKGEVVNLNPEDISSVRGRVSQHLEQQFGECLEAELWALGLDEVTIGVVPAHQYPDFEARFPDHARGLRFEVKAIECLAEEGAANFGTLLSLLDQQADFLVVIVWEWDCSPSRSDLTRSPRVLDLRFFHARSLARLRDHQWLSRPDKGQGSSGLQGFDPLRAWTGTRSDLKPEEKNLGKVLRLYDGETPHPDADDDPLLSETSKSYLAFKEQAETHRFSAIREIFLPEMGRILSGATTLPQPIPNVESAAFCGKVGIVMRQTERPKELLAIMNDNDLEHLFKVTPRGAVTHFRRANGALSKIPKIRAVDLLRYCQDLGSCGSCLTDQAPSESPVRGAPSLRNKPDQ